MGVTIKNENGNLSVMCITGVLKKSEFDAVQAAATKILDNDPSLRIKLLLVVENFEGWERGVNWDDMSFYAAHGNDIAKIAIVGDPKWETELKMFTGAGFRAAPVKFFPPEQLSQARVWLEG